MEKREVEEILGKEIEDSLFQKALDSAKRKQQYIYQQEKREVVLQKWYLVQLIVEQVAAITFSQFTMDLCQTLRNMEKEHQIKDHGAPISTPIVAVQSL